MHGDGSRPSAMCPHVRNAIRHRVAMACIALACVAGCATRSTGIGQRMILPEGVAQYGMDARQAFVFPAVDDGPLPEFPEALAQRELAPTTLCVSLVVDAGGAVHRVAPLAQAGCEAPARFPMLAEAARAAMERWRFRPAMLCTYPDAATRDRDWTGHGCAGAVADATPVAVTLGWAFTFEVREGRARVGTLRLDNR